MSQEHQSYDKDIQHLFFTYNHIKSSWAVEVLHVSMYVCIQTEMQIHRWLEIEYSVMNSVYSNLIFLIQDWARYFSVFVIFSLLNKLFFWECFLFQYWFVHLFHQELWATDSNSSCFVLPMVLLTKTAKKMLEFPYVFNKSDLLWRMRYTCLGTPSICVWHRHNCIPITFILPSFQLWIFL